VDARIVDGDLCFGVAGLLDAALFELVDVQSSVTSKANNCVDARIVVDGDLCLVTASG
jgi:hypothetical protein